MLKKGSDVHQFKTEIFRINPNLPDYSGVVLWGVFETIQYEKLMHIVFGKHDQRGYGTLISTDKRLIFIDAGIDEVLFKESIFLEDINSINFSPSNNIMTIVIPQKTIEIELDHPQSGVPFCEVVHQLISRSKKMEIPDISIILDLVERLGTLKQKGILTDEEFSQEKAKLFSKL
ncbi:PH domain-containing protein [Chryseobacterium tructae]|uniref:PH domain-containing protein n=1 Tax=Chryseobacterium tructae TaxID=1037380 RepID=A0ABV7XZ74_9FLAO|nr:PH domain-containing protein [Chryseobacterium tructae]MDN3692877.1 PH domain-containing protein [Chryseobacterium tructae]